MTVDQYDLVDAFGQAVDQRTGSLFVGAGLSVAAGLPGWSTLLHEPIEELHLTDPPSDLPLLAEWYVQTPGAGRDRLKVLMARSINSAPLGPHEGHDLLARLPVREIWTTNYDLLLEQALPGATVAIEDDDVRNVGTGDTTVIKMHGSLAPDDPEAWAAEPVITRGDFERYEVEHPRTWALLRASYLTRTMLFLGFSFTDPNVELLLRLARLQGTAGQDRHLTVLRRPTTSNDLKLHALRVRDLEATGVRVCEIDDFEELVPLLRALVRRTRPLRLFVSGSGDETDLLPWCNRIGSQLAGHATWQVASLGGTAGWWTTRQVARLRRADGTYLPENLRLHFRRKDTPIETMDERAGTAIFTDLDREELVQQVLDDCRAALILGGGTRTLEEVDRARVAGLGVVPLAATRGSAHQTWSAQDAATVLLGGRPVPSLRWAQLDDHNPDVAVQAAMRLLSQAMYKTGD